MDRGTRQALRGGTSLWRLTAWDGVKLVGVASCASFIPLILSAAVLFVVLLIVSGEDERARGDGERGARLWVKFWSTCVAPLTPQQP